MLTPAAHVPHILCGDVVGLDGTRLALDLPADLLDRCTLWVIGPGMAGAHLDLAGIEALQVLLADAVARLRVVTCGGEFARQGAIQAVLAPPAEGAHPVKNPVQDVRVGLEIR